MCMFVIQCSLLRAVHKASLFSNLFCPLLPDLCLELPAGFEIVCTINRRMDLGILILRFFGFLVRYFTWSSADVCDWKLNERGVCCTFDLYSQPAIVSPLFIDMPCLSVIGSIAGIVLTCLIAVGVIAFSGKSSASLSISCE